MNTRNLLEKVRVSRMERDGELMEIAKRKKSRKVSVSNSLPCISFFSVAIFKVSRQGDYVIITDKEGVLTTQNGTQQVVEKRVKLGSDDFDKLVELGY